MPTMDRINEARRQYKAAEAALKRLYAEDLPPGTLIAYKSGARQIQAIIVAPNGSNYCRVRNPLTDRVYDIPYGSIRAIVDDDGRPAGAPTVTDDTISMADLFATAKPETLRTIKRQLDAYLANQ